MLETLTVTCPDCKTTLIINKKTGEIIEVRKPILEDTTGDRFKDAFLKVKSSKERAEAKFNEAKDKRTERLKNLDQIFKDTMKKVQEKGDEEEKPVSPYDLD